MTFVNYAKLCFRRRKLPGAQAEGYAKLSDVSKPASVNTGKTAACHCLVSSEMGIAYSCILCFVIGHVNIGIVLLFFWKFPMMPIQPLVNFDWLFNTQSRILQADWFILETNGKATLNINMSLYFKHD